MVISWKISIPFVKSRGSKGDSSLDQGHHQRRYARQGLLFPMDIPSRLAYGDMTCLTMIVIVVPGFLNAVLSTVDLVCVVHPRSLFYISTGTMILAINKAGIGLFYRSSKYFGGETKRTE
jgi:hypothetical protein